MSRPLRGKIEPGIGNAKSDHPDPADAPGAALASARGRAFKILAAIEFTSDFRGVIVAQGARSGGYSLFVNDGRLVFVYNFLGIPPEQRLAAEAPTAGRHVVGVEFARDGMGADGEGIGTMFLFIDDRIVASGIFRIMTGRHDLRGDGPRIGRDDGDAVGGDAVSSEYGGGFDFTGGQIVKVICDLDDRHRDIEREMAMALAVD